MVWPWRENTHDHSPFIPSGTSPVKMKAVTEGKHTLLVIAKRKRFFGTRLFDFEVLPQQSQQLKLLLSELPQRVNGSVVVTMEVRGRRFPGDDAIQLMCSIEEERFHTCEWIKKRIFHSICFLTLSSPHAGTSPYLVNEDVIGENGLLLVVVAVEDKNSLAIATKHLTRPVLSTGKL